MRRDGELKSAGKTWLKVLVERAQGKTGWKYWLKERREKLVGSTGWKYWLEVLVGSTG